MLQRTEQERGSLEEEGRLPRRHLRLYLSCKCTTWMNGATLTVFYIGFGEIYWAPPPSPTFEKPGVEGGGDTRNIFHRM